MKKTDMKGLYFHIPFCASKCSYCDFYSFIPSGGICDRYLEAVLTRIEEFSRAISGGFDTIYFGGGTPSYFGGKRIAAIIKKSRECFEISPDCEITVECNPSSVSEELVSKLKAAGVNRISMGVQSAVTEERKSLGRRSDCEQVRRAVQMFSLAGITNISLDLMLGIPNQTMRSLDESLDFIYNCKVPHVSAYMLSLEEGTPLYLKKDSLCLPTEDETADMYLHAVRRLSEKGVLQYEISNFSIPGFESRHNLKYWTAQEYLGIGPSAHSFAGGKRFYFDRDIEAFMNGCAPVSDGDAGGAEEYLMLGLRLSKGIGREEFSKRFGRRLPESFIGKARELASFGLIKTDEDRVSLTEKGFLVSNSVISELLLCLEGKI